MKKVIFALAAIATFASCTDKHSFVVIDRYDAAGNMRRDTFLDNTSQYDGLAIGDTLENINAAGVYSRRVLVQGFTAADLCNNCDFPVSATYKFSSHCPHCRPAHSQTAKN